MTTYAFLTAVEGTMQEAAKAQEIANQALLDHGFGSKVRPGQDLINLNTFEVRIHSR